MTATSTSVVSVKTMIGKLVTLSVGAAAPTSVSGMRKSDMGIRKVKATEVSCDSCGAIQVATDPTCIYGYSGTVAYQNEAGGTGSVQWFACIPECIMNAVTTVIARLYE